MKQNINDYVTVRDLLSEMKPMYLMTPGGFVHLSVDKIKQIINNEITEVNGNAGCRGCNMPLTVEELLNFELIKGGFNDKTGQYEYLVDVPKKIKAW